MLAMRDRSPPIEYNRRMVLRLLDNWAEVEETEGEQILVMRCDIEMRIRRLTRETKIIRNTLALVGHAAVEVGAVTEREISACIKDILIILNVLGLGGFDD